MSSVFFISDERGVLLVTLELEGYSFSCRDWVTGFCLARGCFPHPPGVRDFYSLSLCVLM